MGRFPKALWTASVLWFGVCLGLALTVLTVQDEALPALSDRTDLTPNKVMDLKVPTTAAPWHQKPKPKAKVAVALPPAPKPAPDRSTLTFVGRVTGAEGDERYLFKNKRDGRVLVLQLGQQVSGWTLDLVEERRFRITGPGGMYEVARESFQPTVQPAARSAGVADDGFVPDRPLSD